MKKYLIIAFSLLSWIGSSPVLGQGIESVFQPLTWEQASLLASREGKMVLVNLGIFGNDESRNQEKQIMNNREVMNFLERQVIAVQIDVTTPQGAAFIPRLLLNEYPTYAFFLPYGDLLETVTTKSVIAKPLVLKEAGLRAQEIAAEKKKNTRSLRFRDMTLDEACNEARQQGKLVFVYAYAGHNQPCLLMERNVFTLNRVADFYHSNFINIRLNAENERGWAEKYGISGSPAYLFINADGKLVSRAGGYASAEQLNAYGQKALEKAKGIPFLAVSPEQLLEMAGHQEKMAFISFYLPADASYKEIARTVFTDPDVTEFFSSHFVSLAQETKEQPAFIFTDAGGREAHRVTGKLDAAQLLAEACLAVEGKGLTYMDALYKGGVRDNGFIESYINMLGRAGRNAEAGIVAGEFLGKMNPADLKEKKYWDLFYAYIADPDAELFKYIYAGRIEFFRLFGEQAVKQKLTAVWEAGARRFIKEGVFDEAGFKVYTKRLKKEKVEGWRKIVRDARMEAAERSGDWRTYVELAEEKWYEEKIPDAELYGWGQIINQRCHDEAIRYKAARWFALAAAEMERKERLSGKVNITSYKGFFEKLVDDLIGKK